MMLFSIPNFVLVLGDECAICQERLLWLGDLVHVSRQCPHLLHRDCLQSLIQRTWKRKHVSCPVCRCTSHLYGKGGPETEWIDPDPADFQPADWLEGNEDVYLGAGGGLEDLTEDEWNFVNNHRPGAGPGW